MRSLPRTLGVLCLFAVPGSVFGQAAPGDLAVQAQGVFKTYCYRCHGQDGANEGGLNFIADLKQHPYLVAGNDLVLEPGMAFSIEPGIYLPDRFGIRIEDICVLDDSGLTALNSSERALVSVG